jgi:hypothetical protein
MRSEVGTRCRWMWMFAAVIAASGASRAVAGNDGSTGGTVVFSGYGEMHYNHPSNEEAELDFHRLVLGFGTDLGRNVAFHAELDFEHAFTEPELEFAQLDFWYRDALSFRTGVLLMPVGPLNESHEPPLFYSVERPYVQKYVIPTTWQEPGAGVFGELWEGVVGYRVYAVGGLDATGFSGEEGLRGGRQNGAEARAEDLAGVARVEYAPILNLALGLSGYYGYSSQGESSLGRATVSLAEADGRAVLGGLELSAVFATAFIGDADSISVHNDDVVGERLVGFYGEAALHILRYLHHDTSRDLVAFARYELVDTQARVPAGFERSGSYDRTVVTLGASFLPIPNVAIKADVELWNTDDGADWEQANLGVGFMY